MAQAQPSRLLLVNQVASVDPGTKIRFLACVHSYDIDAATLLVKDRSGPSNSPGSAIHVSIRNLLDGVDRETLEVGAWLNIMAYVQGPTTTSTIASPTQHLQGHTERGASNIPSVEAVMMWSAGVIKVDQYMSAVEALQAVRADND